MKMLCVSCGGKGFYLLMYNGDHKGVITPCEECEDGFKYSKLLADNNGNP